MNGTESTSSLTSSPPPNSDLPLSSLINLWTYDAIAEEYAKNVEESIPNQEINEFISHLPFKAKVLDIGCGSGRDAAIFCRNGLKVIGIDFSSNMMKIAKKTAPEAQFHLMTIENMEFSSQSFDGIWANCSLLHIPKIKMSCVLNKIYSFLKINGIFSLTVKKGNGEGFKKDIRYENTPIKFWAYYQETEIQDLLRKAKFKIVSVNSNDGDHSGNYVSDRLIHIFAVKLKSAL